MRVLSRGLNRGERQTNRANSDRGEHRLWSRNDLVRHDSDALGRCQSLPAWRSVGSRDHVPRHQLGHPRRHRSSRPCLRRRPPAVPTRCQRGDCRSRLDADRRPAQTDPGPRAPTCIYGTRPREWSVDAVDRCGAHGRCRDSPLFRPGVAAPSTPAAGRCDTCRRRNRDRPVSHLSRRALAH